MNPQFNKGPNKTVILWLVTITTTLHLFDPAGVPPETVCVCAKKRAGDKGETI